MTSFTRYYNYDKKIIEISMIEIGKLIEDKKNKKLIAEYVYQRLYTRFLRIFDFESIKTEKYIINNKETDLNVFKTEYKNGFIQLAACSLLVETFAAYLTGENETPRGKACNRFKKVFEYAEKNNNELKIFKTDNNFYDRIRCGILHQGETKGKYTVTRKGKNLLENEKIDAFLFHKYLKELLNKYKEDLNDSKWDNILWDTCRLKIRCIINNGK